MNATTLDSLQRIVFHQHTADGVLTVFPAEPAGVPFAIRRVFTLTGVSSGGARGNHAHRWCTQMLACLAGGVTVEVKDGADELTKRLTGDGTSLVVPPMLWNSLRFDGPATVLAVFCDQLYDERDYVRDWEEYCRLKANVQRAGARPPSSPRAL